MPDAATRDESVKFHCKMLMDRRVIFQNKQSYIYNYIACVSLKEDPSNVFSQKWS